MNCWLRRSGFARAKSPKGFFRFKNLVREAHPVRCHCGTNATESFAQQWRGKLWNAFGYRPDITLKAHADSTKNTESKVTLPTLQRLPSREL